MAELLDLVKAATACAGIFWIVCVPLAKLTGNFDDPRGSIDPAHKHAPAPGRGRNTGGGDIEL